MRTTDDMPGPRVGTGGVRSSRAAGRDGAGGRRLVPELLAALPREVDLAMRAHEIPAI